MHADWLAADWPAPPNVMAGTTLRESEFELPAEASWLRQVHGAQVVEVGSRDFAAGPPEADASVARAPGTMCVVRTADCLPILYCSSDGREIAAAHAGWRGLAAGVAEQTVRSMSAEPGDLLVWLGPGISQLAFEVGDEVRQAFVAHDSAAAEAFVANARGRWQADLYTLARQRLSAAGVSAVYGGGLCTYSDARRFYSYRRDGTGGRLVSFVYRAE